MLSLGPDKPREHALGVAQRLGVNFQALDPEPGAQLGRSPGLANLPPVDQGEPTASLGFIEVRRRHQDGQARGGEVGKSVPELPPRDRIHAGRRLVEQQHARL